MSRYFSHSLWLVPVPELWESLFMSSSSKCAHRSGPCHLDHNMKVALLHNVQFPDFLFCIWQSDIYQKKISSQGSSRQSLFQNAKFVKKTHTDSFTKQNIQVVALQKPEYSQSLNFCIFWSLFILCHWAIWKEYIGRNFKGFKGSGNSQKTLKMSEDQ